MAIRLQYFKITTVRKTYIHSICTPSSKFAKGHKRRLSGSSSSSTVTLTSAKKTGSSIIGRPIASNTFINLSKFERIYRLIGIVPKIVLPILDGIIIAFNSRFLHANVVFLK